MTPHLVKWAETYGKRGLTVVDIDNGTYDALDALKKHVAEKKIPFPVAHDADAKTCKTYAIKGYPAAFLIGVDGKVVWEGFPLPEVKELSAVIEAELAKVKPPADPKAEDPPKEGPKEGVKEPPKEDPKADPKADPKDQPKD